MVPEARGVGAGGHGEHGAVGGALGDGRGEQGRVGRGDGVVGQGRRHHVDRVGPQLGHVLAVRDGAVAGPARDGGEEVVDLAGGGGEVGRLRLADEDGGDAEGGWVAGGAWRVWLAGCCACVEVWGFFRFVF